MAVVATPRRPIQRFERFRWEHPEWWVAVPVGAAWALMLAGGMASWWPMVVAMLVPLAAPDARWLAHRSLAARRQRTIVLHLAAFLGVWLVVGAIAAASVSVLGLGAPAGVATLLAGAAWHTSPARRRALRTCAARRPPALDGLPADLDCLRSGLSTARRCLITCGLPMLSMAVVHNLPLAVALTVLGANERRPGPNAERRAGRPIEAFGLVGLALVVAVTG